MPTSRWRAHLGAGADFEPRSLVAGGNLGASWAATWRANPRSPALCFPGNGGTGRHFVTAMELDERSAETALSLHRLGLRAGDRMLWSTASSLDGVLACLGGLRLGAVLVPVNKAYRRREVTHVVDDVTPRVAVVDDTDQAGWVAEAPGGAGTAIVSSSLVPWGSGGGSGQDDLPGLDQARPEDPALIVFTSGTTGAPKGAVLSHANVLAGSRALHLAWRWDPDDRLVLSLPLFHVHGLAAGLFGTLTRGASAVVLEGFSPQAVVEASAEYRATMFFGVPTMYHRLVATEDVGSLAGLRLCVSGSAPLPVELWNRARHLGLDLLERYGMSETLLTISNPYDGERRPGTVGFPLPGVEIRLEDEADADDGPEAAWPLAVRGPSVFSGYWQRPAATAAAFDGEGWFRTGDHVSVDPDGYVRIRGRRQDLIISGGYNVYPAEVEDVLLAHPAVVEVAVAGVPSEEWGETVVAWVVPAAEGLDEQALLAFAAERLAPYKRPRVVHRVTSLPRNSLGKVLRHELG